MARLRAFLVVVFALFKLVSAVVTFAGRFDNRSPLLWNYYPYVAQAFQVSESGTFESRTSPSRGLIIGFLKDLADPENPMRTRLAFEDLRYEGDELISSVSLTPGSYFFLTISTDGLQSFDVKISGPGGLLLKEPSKRATYSVHLNASSPKLIWDTGDSHPYLVKAFQVAEHGEYVATMSKKGDFLHSMLFEDEFDSRDLKRNFIGHGEAEAYPGKKYYIVAVSLSREPITFDVTVGGPSDVVLDEPEAPQALAPVPEKQTETRPVEPKAQSYIYGDQHITSWDGLVVSHIGCTDTILAMTSDSSFMYQARTCLRGSVAASVCAVALRCDSSASVVEIYATSAKRSSSSSSSSSFTASISSSSSFTSSTFAVYVDKSKLSALSSSTYTAKGSTLTVKPGQVTIQCDSGVEMETFARESSDGATYMDVLTSLPNSLKGLVKGLAGTNNDRKNDDIIFRNGNIWTEGHGLEYVSGVEHSSLKRVYTSWVPSSSENLFHQSFKESGATCVAPMSSRLLGMLSGPSTNSATDVCKEMGMAGTWLTNCIFDYIRSAGDVKFVQNLVYSQQQLSSSGRAVQLSGPGAGKDSVLSTNDLTYRPDTVKVSAEMCKEEGHSLKTLEFLLCVARKADELEARDSSW